MREWPSDNVLVTESKLGGYIQLGISCFPLHYVLRRLTNVNINTTKHKFTVSKKSVLMRKHVLGSVA